MTNTELRAITLQRPWPKLITDHTKRVENRKWTTKYRGLLAIHAGSGSDPFARVLVEQAGITIPGKFWALDRQPWALDSHPTGIVALADLAEICDASITATSLNCVCGAWAQPGRYHWLLDNIRTLPEPLAAVGRLGLWRPSNEVASACLAFANDDRLWMATKRRGLNHHRLPVDAANTTCDLYVGEDTGGHYGRGIVVTADQAAALESTPCPRCWPPAPKTPAITTLNVAALS